MIAAHRTVLITGAASGIGRAMVDAFHAGGAAVVAADIDAGGLGAMDGIDGITTAIVDVADRRGVDALIEGTVQRHGRLDVLCNNAGIPDRFEGVSECTDEEWERILAVNLTGAFYASRRAVQAMLITGGGVIINTASVASFRGGEAGVAYTVAKHGLAGLTRSMAAMYGDDGIRTVAICPGPVTTGITRLNAKRREAGEMSARGEATARRTAALRTRWLDPGDIAAIAVFLASDAASALNGAFVPAESGRMAF